jgi:hypothetical protein
MKFFRYRRSSWKTILGLTQAKKRVKKALGITALLKPFRWLTNQKRTIKRRIGYESTAGRMLRNGLPKSLGCLPAILGAATLTILGVVLIIVGAAFHF